MTHHSIFCVLVEALSYLMSSKKSTMSTEIDQWDVTTLRTNLDEANLELDGSHQMLVERMKAYKRRRLE